MVDDRNLFQRLSLDESLRRTCSIYCQGFLTFSKIALLVVVANATIWAILLPILKGALGVTAEDFQDPQYLVDHIGAFYALMSINVLVSVVIGAVGEGTMIKAVADMYLSREPDFMACLKVGSRKAFTLLSASFMSVVGTMIGFILLVFPGMYLAVKWFVFGPVIIIEGSSALSSLKRSMDLVSGSWCYTFCTFFIVYIFMLVTQMIWGAIFTGGNDASHTLFSVWGSIVAAIPSVVYIPVFAIMKTIMYINLRVEKEGLNDDILARNLGEGGGDVSYRHVPLMDEDEAATLSAV